MPVARRKRSIIFALIGALVFSAVLLPVIFLGARAAGTPLPATASSSLLDRARLGTWSAPERTYNTSAKTGFQESDFLVVNGKYYLFSTSSADPAWVDVYVADTPQGLVHEPPTFTHVAPIRYPSVVKDGNTWHMWGVNPPHRQTEHWTSTNADPTGFAYSDTPFFDAKHPEWAVVDFAARKHPTNGYWYGIGFENFNNSPLLITRAPGPDGPWERLNFQRISTAAANGVFGDTWSPPWANLARPDPDLAFTPDGRAWAFFTGNATLPASYRTGMVEIDIDTGKALGNPVVLFDSQAHPGLPLTVVSDINLVQAPGRPDYILGYTNNIQHPLGILTLPAVATPHDGRTVADLVRLDMTRGFDVGAGMPPAKVRAPVTWGPSGMVVNSNYSGARGYLDSAYVSDFTFQVGFAPSTIARSITNTVAYMGGSDFESGSGVSVQIDATAQPARITATIQGSGRTPTTLDSGIAALAGRRYDVVVRRVGSTVTLAVNDEVTASSTYDAALADLQSWSLASQAPLAGVARYPFLGTIRSFTVTGNGK